MNLALALLLSTLSIFIEILQLIMLVRAIMSWIPGLDGTPFSDFVFTLTEWVITPMRSLFDRFGWGNGMMIDLPFFATFILLSVVSSVL